MPRNRLAAVSLVSICLCVLGRADTLHFVAQWDPAISATNYSWFSANNWWVPDGGGTLVPAGRVPTASEAGVVNGFVEANASGVRVQALTLTNSATVANGTFAIERLQVQSGGRFKDARVNVLTFLQIGGTNCTLEGSELSLLAIGSGILSPLAPAIAAKLYLDRGSLLRIAGQLSLTDGSEINTLGPPQNTISVGGILASTDAARIRGSASNHLIIDNSGLIRVDRGTLKFEEEIDWQSSANLGEFRAADVNAVLLFSSPMQVPAYVTSLFTGLGTNRFAAGATVDGQAHVGMADNTIQFFRAGHLVVDDSVGGSGVIRVLGSSNDASVLTWNHGALSLSGITVENGAEMDIAGGAGTSRILSGCALTNLGLCALLSPDLAVVEGASIHNEQGGVFDVRAAGTFSTTPLPGSGQFDNAGIFRKSTTGIMSFGALGGPQGPDFNNTGLVELQNGNLNLCGGISSGEFRTGPAATLWFWGGIHVLSAGSVFTGDGLVRVSQGIDHAAWQVTGGLTAETVEVGANGTVRGSGKTPPVPIRIGRVVARENGLLTNGGFEVQNLELRDQVSLADSILIVSKTAGLWGTNCMLNGSALNIEVAARAEMGFDAAREPARLSLREGARLQIAGRLAMADGALISGGGLPQSRLIIPPGGILNCTNSATLRGMSEGHLVIDNSGIVRCDGGMLAFEDGIDWQSTGGLAQFHAADVSTVVLFASPFQWPATATCIFTGPGTNRLSAGGVIAGVAQVGLISPGTQTLVPGNLEIEGDLGGPGALHVRSAVAEEGGLVWRNGTLSLATLNVDPGGRVLIAGSSASTHQLAGCVINNSGLLTWPGQQLSAGAGAVMNIWPGGTFDVQGDATLLFNNTAPRMALRNSGTFIKSAGNASSTLAVDFTNGGQLEIRTGNLEVQGALVQDLGSTLLQAGAVISAATFTVRGGSVSGAGVIDAVVENSGIVAPGMPVGVLTVSAGKNFHQAFTGMLEIELGGGNPGTQHDQIVIGGAARLGGVLGVRLVDGFSPQIGETFTILACGSVSGSFSTTSGVPPAGTAWVPRYTSTNVTVTLAKALDFACSAVSPGVFGLSFTTTAGFRYVVEASDNLDRPNWRAVQLVDGDGFTESFKDQTERPHRYYRVRIQ